MDLTVAFINRIKSLQVLNGCLVGEVIPQRVSYPFVWVGKSSEEYAEDLNHPATIDYTRYDVEVVDTDLNNARSLSSEIKKHLLNTPLHSIEFINDQGSRQTIHGIVVHDHDDSYVPKAPDSEERVFIAAIDVETIMGELV